MSQINENKKLLKPLFHKSAKKHSTIYLDEIRKIYLLCHEKDIKKLHATPTHEQIVDYFTLLLKDQYKLFHSAKINYVAYMKLNLNSIFLDMVTESGYLHV